jgi:hypothetical protein
MRNLYPAWTTLAQRVVDRPAVQRVLNHEGIKVF